jgi:hypothetical protein
MKSISRSWWRTDRSATSRSVWPHATSKQTALPPVIMGSAKDIVEHCGVPRFVFSDFPLGNSAGKPHDPTSQRETLSLALLTPRDCNRSREPHWGQPNSGLKTQNGRTSFSALSICLQTSWHNDAQHSIRSRLSLETSKTRPENHREAPAAALKDN